MKVVGEMVVEDPFLRTAGQSDQKDCPKYQM